jgi:hypothetical protein
MDATNIFSNVSETILESTTGRSLDFLKGVSKSPVVFGLLAQAGYTPEEQARAPHHARARQASRAEGRGRSDDARAGSGAHADRDACARADAGRDGSWSYGLIARVSGGAFCVT